jgi:hypothetical protein
MTRVVSQRPLEDILGDQLADSTDYKMEGENIFEDRDGIREHE